MAQNIYLDPAGAAAKIEQAKKYKENHETAIANLRTLINGLNEVWQGNSQTKLVQEFESFNSTFNNFNQLLTDYIAEMTAWKKRLEDADQQ